MKISNIPSEYAIAFIVAVTFIVTAFIVIGTQKVSEDLDDIGISMEKTRAAVEKNGTSSPPAPGSTEFEMQ
ncbi:MAG: hypothetical protein OEV93_02880 [Candidatus Moranbacteria bacterium]|nr:hypothetical protein [Candidatus Moranbacteria bacterium]